MSDENVMDSINLPINFSIELIAIIFFFRHHSGSFDKLSENIDKLSGKLPN